MQRKLSFIKTAVQNVGYGLKASVNGGLNKRLFGGRWAMQNEVGDLLLKPEAARVTNTKSQPPKVSGAEMLGDASNAVVSPMTTTFLKANIARGNIKLVVHDQNGMSGNFVELD